MKTIGLVKSLKENENRRALLPNDLKKIKNRNRIFIEKGYGEVLGYKDKDYQTQGVTICSREEALSQSIICDPKIGDAEYLGNLKNQIVFGWIHAVQNKHITDTLVKGGITAIAWEDMHKDERHIFYRNNEIAGEAAIMHAYLLHGIFPYETSVGVIGRGNIANGAIKILTKLGADVTVYNRKTEKLLRKELPKFDIIVNAIQWDVLRNDHIIYKDDLAKMKEGAMIIDISCDRHGAIETSVPTSIESPIYEVDGIIHYVVDHTPTLFYKTISKTLSEIVSDYIDDLISEGNNPTLENATIIKDGQILDEKIRTFQGRLR